MTNEQKAARLEEIATHYIQIGQKDATLLREAAAMMRERGGVQWGAWSTGVAAVYKRRIICIEDWKLPAERRFRWDVGGPDVEYCNDAFGYADTLEAAQAAAVAWVDEQEGGI